MTARLVRALDTMRAVWGETRVWDRHLAGEGPATLRRQREAAAAARAVDPPESPEPQGRPAGGRMPIARGEPDAMTAGQKRGALLFFGRANCVACHAVAGPSNEMFRCSATSSPTASAAPSSPR